MTRTLEYTVLDMIESAMRTAKTTPLNLGGVTGAGGGVGGPPGGFVGWLPQTRVAYDETEAATLDTPASGMSLLDNLNHIRYRIGVIESGSTPGTISVIDDNDILTYGDIDTIHFSGAGVSVVNLGGGEVQVVITASGGGGIEEAPINGVRYGRQNAAWVDLDAVFAAEDTINIFTRSQSIDPPADENALSLHTIGNATVLGIIQETENTNVSDSAISVQRLSTGTGNITSPLILVHDDEDGTGDITGDFISYNRNLAEVFKITASGHVYDNGELLITEAPINGQSYARQDGDWVVASGVSGGAGGTGQAFYFNSTVSSISEDSNAMRDLNTTLFTTTFTDLSVASIASGETKFQYMFITPEFWPGIISIPEGTFRFYVSLRQTAGTREVTGKMRLYKRTSGGTQTLLVETDSTPVLTSTSTTYELTAIGGPFTLNDTDRLIAKLYLDGAVAGTDATIVLRVHSGTERLELPSGTTKFGTIKDSGWIPVSEDWTRTGNHTFLVPGDQSAIYRKGAKIRYKDGGSYEYGVLETPTVGGNTTVNLTPNSTYAMAAATITDKYISYTENPEGWPNVAELKDTTGELHRHTYSNLIGGNGVYQTVTASSTNQLALYASGFVPVGANAPISKGGTLKNLYVRIAGAQPASGSLVFTIMINNVASTITCTLAAGAGAGGTTLSDTTHTETVAAGDLVYIRVVNNATAASAPVGVFMMELETTTP